MCCVDEFGVAAQIAEPLADVQMSTYYISTYGLGHTLVCTEQLINAVEPNLVLEELFADAFHKTLLLSKYVFNRVWLDKLLNQYNNNLLYHLRRIFHFHFISTCHH